MFDHIKNHLLSLGFTENGSASYVKEDVNIAYAENAYHLSFYLRPIGNVTLVNRIEENGISELQIDKFIDCVGYIKNKLY
jgi:hypothetical protein